MSQELIQSAYSHYIIIGCSVGGLVWGGVNAMFVSTPSLFISMRTGHQPAPSIELQFTNATLFCNR